MKKKFSVLLSMLILAVVAVCLLALPQEAKAATSGYYTYSVSNGEATITDCNTSISGDVVIPDTLGGYPVTSIGNYAFQDCTSLTSVTIGDGVESIGWGAFWNCTGLTSVTIPDSVKSIDDYTFRNCTGLTSVTIGNSVESIGEDAFSYCTRLTSVTIPDSVTSIGNYAFDNCTGLTSVTIGNSVKSIGSYAFRDCTGLTSVTIPDSVTSIGNYAFYNCTGLTSVTIGNSVESIGDDAFSYCTGLTSITIPDSVTSIGSYAFYKCTGLTGIWVDADNVNYSSDRAGVLFDKNKQTVVQAPDGITGSYTIPDSVESIGSYAFSSCTGLKSVTIGNSVESIGEDAFSSCTGLKSVTIGNSVESIGEYAFLYCTGLTSITIPDSVESIGWGAFSSCTGLTSITIGNSVTSIGTYAFKDCTSLTSVTIGNSVTSIGSYAFSYCKGLTSITIPDSVTSIGYEAFDNCTGLKDVYYAGSQDAWNNISIGSYNYSLTNATMHYMHTHDYSVYPAEVVAPTCTEKGYTKYTCIYGEEYRTDYVPALGHSVGKDAVTVAPTCTEDGYIRSTCPRCGKKGNIKNADALGHDYTGAVKVGRVPGCEADGWEGASCTRCDSVRNDSVLSATGHNPVLTEDVAPTCEKAGSKGGTHCSNCNKVFVKPTVIPATGHSYTKKVVAATYTKQGYTQYTCHCGHSYKDSYVKAKGLLAPSVKIASDAKTGKPVISWKAVAEANSYVIYRATSKTGSYTKLTTTTKTSYTDSSAALGKAYYYKVVAVCKSDSKLNSKNSNIVSAVVKCGQPTVKVSVSSKGKVTISWGKVTGAKKYDVYYATSKNGTYKKLTSTTKTSYTYSKATAGKEYYFKVCAYSTTATTGAYSAVSRAVIKLATPSLTVTVKNGQATVKWKKITGATAYELQCSVSGGAYKTVATVTGTSYTHKGLAGGNQYTYRLRAKSSVSDAISAFSATKKVVVKCAAPTITVTLKSNNPTITWGKVAGAVKYQVYYGTSKSGKYKLLGTVTGTSYTHKGAPAAKACYYKVVAVDKNGNQGEYSAYKTVTPKCLAPATVKVTLNSKKKPVITWSKVSGAKKYEVYVATSLGGTYKKLTSLNKLTYTYSKAKAGTTYYFKITAYGSSTASRSDYSVVVKTP